MRRQNGVLVAAEELFRGSSMAPHTATTLRSLGDLNPSTLALMHGPAFSGDGKRAFYELAAAYEQLTVAAA